MDNKTLRRQQLITTWLAVPILIILCVGTPVLALVFIFSDFMQGGAQPQVWQILVFLVIVTVPAILLTVAIFKILHHFAAQTFDPLFTTLGLKGSGYLNTGRQFHGKIDGRRVDVYLHPVTRQRSFVTLPGAQVQGMTYFGHIMQIYVEAKSTGRFGLSLLGAKLPTGNSAIDLPSAMLNNIQDTIFNQGLSIVARAVTTASQATTFQPAASGLHELTATTFDQLWAERLLATETAVEPLKRLARLAPKSAMFTVQALPASVKIALHLHKELLTEKTIQEVMAALVQFAAAVESAPQPSVTFSESRLEYLTRTNPGYFTRYVYLGLAAFFILLLVGMGVFFSTLYYFDQL